MASGIKSFLYNEDSAAKRLKIAAVAMQCDREREANRARMARTVETIVQAHPDVELVFFGELSLGWFKPGEMPDYLRGTAEPIPGETTRLMARLAAQHRICLSFGMLESSGGALYNAQVLINPAGEIQTVHRKVNLKAKESAVYQPGDVSVTVTDIKGIRTGMVICSDAASPRTMRELIRSRLDLILLSLADDRDEGFFMAKSNARLYDAWIATANRYGDEDGWFWNGHMVVSDPLGALRATAQDAEQYLFYELRFADARSQVRRLVRRVVVGAPLVAHLVRNWKQVREYF
jgi:predicted amidohydrolase